MSKFGLIRYPGSKAKLWKPVLNVMPSEITMQLWSAQCEWEYREPFFGSGAIGFRVLNTLDKRCKVWLNDKDYWLVCLWNVVRSDPKELIRRIKQFKPSPDAFFEFKEKDGDLETDPIRAGFMKLALHQMSVSGFGVKSGTCLGGRNQTNAEYPVDCRWNPIRLTKHVKERHDQLKRFGSNLRITCRDFGELFENTSRKCFIYLDPPYYEKGGMLYKHSMSHDDHVRLAQCAVKTNAAWAVSYDDHPAVRELYANCQIDEIAVRYSNATGAANRPKNKEVLITSASRIDELSGLN